jgi:hypothetical protein
MNDSTRKFLFKMSFRRIAVLLFVGGLAGRIVVDCIGDVNAYLVAIYWQFYFYAAGVFAYLLWLTFQPNRNQMPQGCISLIFLFIASFVAIISSSPK